MSVPSGSWQIFGFKQLYKIVLKKDLSAPVRRIDKVRIEAAEVNHILLTCKSGTFEPFIHQCDLLPNQARDKHRENTKQTTVVSPAKGDSAKARGASSVGLSGA
jgi:hypothetical protein